MSRELFSSCGKLLDSLIGGSRYESFSSGSARGASLRRANRDPHQAVPSGAYKRPFSFLVGILKENVDPLPDSEFTQR